MKIITKILKFFPAYQLWIFSILLFWSATVIIYSIDYIADKWLDIILFRDYFLILFLPLIIIQLFSGVILLASAVKFYSIEKKLQSIILGFISVMATATICFLSYAFFAFWYSIYFMGRSL
ncbi:MAG: hypothetical protein HRU38_02805 [Saccharospirillaceae bacterium]|nr:hypothetical protein [Pseudomonadales bacterium]NRB77592.1 hypothetical protein [Saccharospirillaceae bacterium]